MSRPSQMLLDMPSVVYQGRSQSIDHRQLDIAQRGVTRDKGKNAASSSDSPCLRKNRSHVLNVVIQVSNVARLPTLAHLRPVRFPPVKTSYLHLKPQDISRVSV